ncbi:DNA mismatch endonuclease Vsr [Nocardioides jishulii]|uniref:DNA mismatch endonuclease Vsr n=1 Tax=Nocardioides jishulii TaxID=2575440 RepID=A0A4U2YT42_9ACTN|nr:DNA mismatch endonuclease Vsr [Nocardioides jishulii]QCX28488.1 DNA mismatch endonuclease Vsr [Nocardioides jishulii]TKI64619.1 DNA mismatch endonuclease Vsr [Nocardioides jishulii]
MGGREPEREAPPAALTEKMSTYPRRDTRPELLLRRELHRRGLRYRVQLKVPANRRRTIDVAFTRIRLAVFVDGCFWHGCPEHGTQPQRNSEWWRWKIQRNQDRDADTDALLKASGWTVLRIWEHEDVLSAADRIEQLVRVPESLPHPPLATEYKIEGGFQSPGA